MANVSIKFNNKDFLLSCDDGQEEHLEELLIHINKKFNDLKNDLGNLGENKLLLITAVKTAAELINQYGTLENLLKNASKIKQNKRRETLINNKDDAIISKKLVTLKKNVPVKNKIEEFILKSI